MDSIAIIPARGGSKRIPKKNIKAFLGKPIIAYSIEIALKSNLFKEVIVSTDDPEIAEIAKRHGAKVPFLRSAKNADDYATLSDVILEVLESLRNNGVSFETFCCILPTAPFISLKTISESYSLLLNKKVNTVLIGQKFSYPIWRSLKIDNGLVAMNFPKNRDVRSQDLPDSFHDSGQLYWCKTSSFLTEKVLFNEKTALFEISALESQDIDTLEDWALAELKMQLNKDKNDIHFYATGNNTSGFGHLQRVKAVCRYVNNDYNCILHTTELPDVLYDSLNQEFKEIQIYDDIEIFKKSLSKYSYLKFIDTYELAYDDLVIAKNNSNTLICIDDYQHVTYPADIVINHAPSIDESTIKKLHYTKVFTGLGYSMVNSEFLNEIGKNPFPKNINTIFICFGGADPLKLANSFTAYFESLDFIQNIQIVSSYPPKIKSQKITHYSQLSPSEIKNLMLKSDLLVLPSSTMLYEGICLNKPIVSGYFTENQKNVYNGFFSKNLIKGLGDLRNKINYDNITHFLKNQEWKTYDLPSVIQHPRNNFINLFKSTK